MTHTHKPHVPKNQPCFQTALPATPLFPLFPYCMRRARKHLEMKNACKNCICNPKWKHLDSMERGPELSAVLWTVLILCIILIVYLSFVPEDRQRKDKEAADAFTATVIPSFKKKPDDKKET